MKIHLGLLLILIPAGVVAWQSHQEVPVPDDPLDGFRLMESKGCVECHSIGAGGFHIGPNLNDGLFAGTFMDLGAGLWNHVPGMSVSFEITHREWPRLDENEVRRLLSFLYFVDYLGQPGDPENGARVFRGSAGCATCHGIGGGERTTGPDLARLSTFASPLYVAQEIWNHGPAMIESIRGMGLQVPMFDERDLADLSAFIRQQAGSGIQERSLLTPGNPNQGRRVFSAKGCSSCHGASGRGGGGGPDLSAYDLRRPAEAVAGAMWNHSFAMRDAMLARGLAWPTFQGSELADVVAFLYFLSYSDPPGDPGRGEGVFTDRSCSECHGGGASSGVLTDHAGPSLAETEAAYSPAGLVAAMWNHAPVMMRAILGEGRPWPELSGRDLRDLRAYLQPQPPGP
jgi:mono/diheme cytochrome c family protein